MYLFVVLLDRKVKEIKVDKIFPRRDVVEVPGTWFMSCRVVSYRQKGKKKNNNKNVLISTNPDTVNAQTWIMLV